MEEWRDIKGFEGYYQISNMGRVKSVERTVWDSRGYYKTISEKILKPYAGGDGYLQLNLSKDGKVEKPLVHRLVATAFLENSEGYKEINHKDENKQNNCVDNLEWCSRSYNNRYNDKAKKAGKKTAEKLSKPVYSINKESGLITYWESAKVASRQTGIASSNICACLKGRQKSCGNHYWFYADDDNE